MSANLGKFSLDAAIEANRSALLRILANLFVLAGLSDPDNVKEVSGRQQPIPRHIRNMILRIVRPAESAVRRLIVATAQTHPCETDLAQDIIVNPVRQAKPVPWFVCPEHARFQRWNEKKHRAVDDQKTGATTGYAGASPVPAFPLFDSQKKFDFYSTPDGRLHWRKRRGHPRLTVLGVSGRALEPRIVRMERPSTGYRIHRRLMSIKCALDDLPGQALRLAKATASRARRNIPLTNPVRIGTPPGYRKQRREEIHDVLLECHRVALHAREKPT